MSEVEAVFGVAVCFTSLKKKKNKVSNPTG
jgi:hypothetical protein